MFMYYFKLVDEKIQKKKKKKFKILNSRDC